MSASTPSDSPVGLLRVAISGIQDVSPFLPLLGSGQCEELVTSALQKGLLYAAATPMSIFGSLGIAKAGFVVFCTSIDNRLIRGPSLLRNAGFQPSGVGALLARVSESNRQFYVAEEKIRCILSKKRIRAVNINKSSRDLLWWNIRLFVATVVLGGLGILPYVFIITQYLSSEPFQATWLFPVMRIAGCGTVAFTIQIIFQLRILEETYCRIRFMATDSYLKDHGKPLPAYWDPNEHSKEILKELKQPSRAAPPSDPLQTGQSGPHRSGSLDNATKHRVRHGLGTISSFSFPVYGEEPSTPTAETPSSFRAAYPPNTNIAERGLYDLAMEQAGFHGLTLRYTPRKPDIYLTTVFVTLAQGLLLVGLGMTVVGYIGCFTVVQARPTRADWKGPLSWVGCEVGLALLRTWLWALNPTWDDAKSPIALEKVVIDPVTRRRKPSSSYGIGWGLDLVTADDTHALIVGIDDFDSPDVRNLKECVHDAKLVAEYLEDTLLVPHNQIVSLHNSQATKQRIIKELKLLSEKLSVLEDAPIVIYFATHSFVREENKRTYLIPYQGFVRDADDGWQSSLPYDTIVDLLQLIGREKTDNITLILDTCHAGAMGQNHKFDPPPSSKKRKLSDHEDVAPRHPNTSRSLRAILPMSRHVSTTTTEILIGHSSHVLLAGTGPDQRAQENSEGGVFTRHLLDALKNSVSLEQMTHKDLVQEINDRFEGSGTRGQQALCTSIYQNRLLFNGLFSRRVAADGGGTPLITVQYSDDH